VGFRPACDTTNRELLHLAMGESKTFNKFIGMVKSTAEDTKSHVGIQSDVPAAVISKNGDALACLLFNIAPEKTVRYTVRQTNGTIFYTSAQLLAYAVTDTS
jgi:hypothetical protein